MITKDKLNYAQTITDLCFDDETLAKHGGLEYNVDYIFVSKSELTEAICAATVKHETQLREATRELFEDYLDLVETNDEGRPFRPIFISNCRVMTVEPMAQLLQKIKRLSGLE
jgi:hypothetical protein